MKVDELKLALKEHGVEFQRIHALNMLGTPHGSSWGPHGERIADYVTLALALNLVLALV